MDTTKIIKGVVNSGRYTVTAPIMQEHYGIILKIEGAELPETYQVDFSNDEHHGTSVTMIGNADGVLIPRQFIDTGKDVFAFLYWVGEDYGKTVYKFRIPNKCRPDRTDDTPTPEEQSTIDQAISALNTAVAQTAEDRENADASAQSAYESADEAQQARDNAQTYANNAQTSANNASASASQASASATASAQSASQSAQIKADVEDLVDDAQGYAQASERSASASANSASQAQGFAQSASASAQSASGYASNAQSYSQTASAKAQDASQSASTASQKATESAQSASQALTYKTDAESAKTASQTAQGLAESAKDTAVQAKEDAESARDEAQSLVDGISGKVEQIESNTERIESLEDDRYKPYATDSASGAIASFPDGADGIPLKSLVVSIEPKQDGTGDPSPDNVRPISGWTGMTVNATGKNLLDPTLLKDQVTWNIIPFYAPVGTVLTMSTNQQTAATSGLLTYFRTPNGTQGLNENVYDGHPATKTVGEEGYLEIIQRNRDNITSYADYEYQIEVGSTATSYESYQGQSIPISWQTEAGTVYGGKLDVLGGVLRVDRQYVDMGTLTWGTTSVESCFRAGINNKGWVQPTISEVTEAICDRYKARAHNNVIDGENGTFFIGRAGVNYIYVKDTNYTDVSDFQSAMNGAQLVVPIVTPIEIQLTPHEVNSLLGVNNIWADTGDTEVEYRANTKLYIERLTAPDSADMIADANIVSGQYFMVGNNLYKATANIANGGQITVGTNCTRVSLAQALNEINA